MSAPRFSREDLYGAAATMAHLGTVGLGGHDTRMAMVPTQRLKLWAAMLSEAAATTPTHDELMAQTEGHIR